MPPPLKDWDVRVSVPLRGFLLLLPAQVDANGEVVFECFSPPEGIFAFATPSTNGSISNTTHVSVPLRGFLLLLQYANEDGDADTNVEFQSP